MRNNKYLVTALAAVLAGTLGSVGTVRADDLERAGVVHISDQQPPAPAPAAEPAPAAAHQPMAADRSTCPDGDCQCRGDCRGHGGHWGRYGQPHSPLEAMLHHQGTVSPDDGWARPVKNPIRRNPVEYRRYWPSKWWGQPGSALTSRRPAFPQVYMPTDTTQLGYYYQKAPQWRPNPAMVPPMPWPSAWHRRECPLQSSAYGLPAGATVVPTTPTPAGGPHAAPSAPPQPQARAFQNRPAQTRN